MYISDIGATNLRPLFISCAGWQGLGYVITVALEFFQRSGYLPFQLKKKTLLSLIPHLMLKNCTAVNT